MDRTPRWFHHWSVGWLRTQLSVNTSRRHCCSYNVSRHEFIHLLHRSVEPVNFFLSQRLKVKGPNIYIPPLTGKPEQQRYTMRSGVLTSTSSRQRGATSGRPLPEWTDFGPTVAARQTHLCPSQPHYSLHPAMFSDNDSLFLLGSITRYYILLLIYLPRLRWLEHLECK